jgi:hypothetical protein
MSRFAQAVLAALLVSGPASAQSLDFTVDRLHFTLTSPHDVKLTADGVPLIRESHIYLVTPGWTSSLLNADEVTPTVSSSYSGGVYTGTAVYENSAAKITYTYLLGPDDTYKATVNYVSKGAAAEVEWDMAYLNANVIAGCPWSATIVRGSRSGTVPVFAKSSDQTASRLCPPLKTVHFDTNLGPLDVSVQGSDSSVASFTLFDARAMTPDWAQRNPVFWFGVGDYQIPTAGQTVSATWHLGAAPVRSFVNTLGTPPTIRDVRTAKVPFVPEFPVIPHPKQSSDPATPCRLGQSVYIATSASPSAEETEAATELQSELSTYWGVSATIGSSPTGAAPTISLGVSSDSNVPQYAEGYLLNVGTSGVTVAGHDPHGVYNGAQTVKQLLRADANGVYVKSASIRDWPSLSMRGIHWFGGPNSYAFHKKMIDLILAPYKLNTMMYECEFGYWTSHPEIWSTTRGMTKTDMQNSVNYARAHFIEPIPLINSLGHADWMFTNGQHLDLATDPTAPYQYNPEDPAVYTILFDVMGEAADLFKPKYFHIGHDEVTTGGVFPPVGSTKSATDLILADTVKINNWIKARGMQTMMWGDEFLYYPTEASDAGNATDMATAAARRAGLPKDIIVADWHYASATSFPSVPIWRNAGWQVVGVPWYDWTNIQNLTSTVTQNTGMGMIQSTWAGWSMYPDIVNTNAYSQFCAYLVAAEMSWTGGNPGISALGYSPDDAFRQAWNRAPVDVKSYRGYVSDSGTTNAKMWDWVPGSTSTGGFPTGDQIWNGVTFSVGNPVYLAGGLNPAGTWPQAVVIPLNGRVASEFDVLWGTTWIGEVGSPVASFWIYYTDGSHFEVPCVYGTQISAFLDSRSSLQTSTVWSGTDSLGQNSYVRRWSVSNPQPSLPIQSVIIRSEMGEAAPVLLSLTGLVGPSFTLADVVRALRLSGGLDAAVSADVARYGTPNTPSPNVVNTANAVHAARIFAGLDY